VLTLLGRRLRRPGRLGHQNRACQFRPSPESGRPNPSSRKPPGPPLRGQCLTQGGTESENMRGISPPILSPQPRPVPRYPMLTKTGDDASTLSQIPQRKLLQSTVQTGMPTPVPDPPGHCQRVHAQMPAKGQQGSANADATKADHPDDEFVVRLRKLPVPLPCLLLLACAMEPSS